MTVFVAPALLGADPLELRAAIDQVEQSQAPYLHLDVMDGHYTNDINFGIRTIAAIRDHTRMQLDVHLQTLQPERYVDDLIRIGANRVSMHVDAATHIDAALDALQTAGVRKGLVLNPDLGIEQLDPYLGRLDFIILMTSKPGTSTFDPAVANKIRDLRARLTDRYLDTVELIADGGITVLTAPQVIAAGVDTLVAASAIFKSEDKTIATAISRLAKSCDSPADGSDS
ncbi:ribulose-phosphate 3-epimerase [Nocardia transvalensis]|uniref:ribulose-phosphate 3-epimerase n=1 Tax=Nocardia transvalensis TaxID=37333 RepID=UPI001893C81D|nr:ribulose-phosphate 3-epimerase [Nocardia transvalensis]MBF6333195.1 ribulose-phosphate 3-epimerase [Nocardia transvalensis]